MVYIIVFLWLLYGVFNYLQIIERQPNQTKSDTFIISILFASLFIIIRMFVGIFSNTIYKKDNEL